MDGWMNECVYACIRSSVCEYECVECVNVLGCGVTIEHAYAGQHGFIGGQLRKCSCATTSAHGIISPACIRPVWLGNSGAP